MSISIETINSAVTNGLTAIKQHIPEHVLFWDGKEYKVPRWIKTTFELWRSIPDLKQECNMVYDQYQGGDLLDVGSLNAWYGLLLAPKAKEAVSFVFVEANPDALPQLYSVVSFLALQFPHIRCLVIPQAAGNGGIMEKNHPMGYESHPRYDSKAITGEGDKCYPSVAVKIDEICDFYGLNPDLLKIDVEGAEFTVLQGCTKTLENRSTSLMLEVHPNDLSEGIKPDVIFNWLESKKYCMKKEIKGHASNRQIWAPSNLSKK